MASRFDTLYGLVNAAAERAVSGAPPVSDDLGGALAEEGLDFSGMPAFAFPTANDPDLWDGSQIVKRSEARTSFYGLDEGVLEDFQRKAFEAGLYGHDKPERVRFGDYDEATFSIWEAMVDRAVGFFGNDGKKVSPMDAFDMATQVATSFETEGRNPLTVSLTNPADIKEAMREAAQDAIGKGAIDEARLDQIVAKWQGMERGFQQQQYDAAETGGTLVQPPSFENFAEQEARRIDPTAAGAHDVLDKFSIVLQRLGGER